jgi:hypothetical protein
MKGDFTDVPDSAMDVLAMYHEWVEYLEVLLRLQGADLALTYEQVLEDGEESWIPLLEEILLEEG